MASTKSAATLDRETSQRVVRRETLASLRKDLAERDAIIAAYAAELAEVRKERDFFKANSLRKEGVIQMLQKKVERTCRPRRPSQDDLDAYFAAHPHARTVTPEQLAAFVAR